MTTFGGFSDPVVASAAEHLPDLEVTLRALGVAEDEIARARELNTLDLLAVERIVLPARADHDLVEIAELTGVSTDGIVRLWRSLGFPTPRPGDKIFTDIDAQLLTTVA